MASDTDARRQTNGAFLRGDRVVLRNKRVFCRHGLAVGFAVAGFAVADGNGLSAVATTPGSAMRIRAGGRSGPNSRLLSSEDWDGTHDERLWQGPTVVRVHRAGDRWSVWRWHDGFTWSDGWYGNLESPWVRSAIGFDTQDWALDVVCAGEPGTYHWQVRYKDEDELQWLLDQGEVSEARVAMVREAGEQLTTLAKNGRWPFNADWSEWVPDPAWYVAAMPEGWNKLP